MQVKTGFIVVLGPDPPARTVEGLVWIPLVRVVGVRGCSLHVLEKLRSARAIAFTSPRAPRILYQDAVEYDVWRELASLVKSLFTAAVGPSTAKAVRNAFGVEPATPKDHSVRGLVKLLEEVGATPVVVPRSAEATTRLENLTRRLRVFEITCYRLELSREGYSRLVELLGKDLAKVLVASSPSIAKILCKAIAETGVGTVVVVSFSGPTLETVRRHCRGIRVATVAENTYDAAIEAAMQVLRG